MEAYPPEPWLREIRKKKKGLWLTGEEDMQKQSTNIIYMGEGGGGGEVEFEFEFELDSSALRAF